MCVIAYSKKGVDIPSEEDLHNMWRRNPDGAGIMMELPGNINSYVKGLMTWDDFKNKLDELKQAYNLKELNVAIHFRIGTAGKNDGPTTHPFVLSNKYRDLRQLSYFGTKPTIMHNGVISGFGGKLDKLSSDTQDFVALILNHLVNQIDVDTLKQTVNKLINGSRMIIFDKGNIIQFGDWKEKNGISYSNLLWEPTPVITHPKVSYKTEEPSIDQYGMATDISPSPYAGIDWIQYSSKEKMKEILQKAGYTRNEAKTKNRTEVYYAPYYYKPGITPDRYKYTVDEYNPTMIYNDQGLEKYLEMLDLFQDQMDEGYDPFDDVIQFVSVTELADYLQELVYDNKTDEWFNQDTGEQVYIDRDELTVYTNEGLKTVYGKNWRNARKELKEENKIDTNWLDPTKEELDLFNKKCKGELKWETSAA